jgi:hypothetical protein
MVLIMVFSVYFCKSIEFTFLGLVEENMIDRDESLLNVQQPLELSLTSEQTDIEQREDLLLGDAVESLYLENSQTNSKSFEMIS